MGIPLRFWVIMASNWFNYVILSKLCMEQPFLQLEKNLADRKPCLRTQTKIVNADLEYQSNGERTSAKNWCM